MMIPISSRKQATGYRVGYKKQKVQGWNTREEVKEHNSARGPSPGGGHAAPMKTDATERTFGGRAYMVFYSI